MPALREATGLSNSQDTLNASATDSLDLSSVVEEGN